MIGLILLVVFGPINVIIALIKGFNPVVWFFGAGILGLIVILFMPSARKVKKTDEVLYKKRKEDGNNAGYIMLGVVILAIIANVILSNYK